jgi:hypothetical protein
VNKNLIPTAEVAKRAQLQFNEAKKLLADAGVKPHAEVPMGKRTFTYWNLTDVQPFIDKVNLERIQKRLAATQPPAEHAPVLAPSAVVPDLDVVRNQLDALSTGQAGIATELTEVKAKVLELHGMMQQILEAMTSPDSPVSA